ncbi:hypothetical protein K1X12_11535 [Hyphomonas sp. WL0036]|uniref:hypothetical protein n=1 Tax=Hyphomonas sediminis TaxID=2866160 RepID=UPI001C80009E|nr:hypothetical protein [Hyphomonas sediminis]MBY9067535.1 hypothetical protein [Hyphomonas sediminis]
MTYSRSGAGRLKAVLLATLLAGTLAACGGGGSSGTSAPPPSAGTPPSPPPPPPPTGIGFELDGSASKGMIFGGTVKVSDANDPDEVLATVTTDGADGSFDLSVSPSLNFGGGILKITVTGNPTATMVCDAQPGCNGAPIWLNGADR